jgi:hypothetical protein
VAGPEVSSSHGIHLSQRHRPRVDTSR